ncbi:hypothetical protein [Apilactobacillus timberlakei]|nr:hypothetical protein [Apilactobacillus timberlakei]
MGFKKQSDNIKSNSGFDELSFMIVILYGILKLFHVKQTENRWTISAIIVGIILTLSSLGLITYIIITKKAIF